MSEVVLHTGSEEWLEKYKIHRFSHEAMATVFELFLAHEDHHYASQAADEAFSELDSLEQELSRFIENSDISRINSLSKNQSVIVGPDVFECLQACQKIYGDTEGAFDISSGPLIELWRDRDKHSESEFESKVNTALKLMGREKLELNPVSHEITLLVDNIQLDLGGYGKGYALDRMGDILEEWDMSIALLHGGRSSALALDSPMEQTGWPLSISNPENPEEVIKKFYLKRFSISGSGLQKGSHIINPYNGYPVQDRIAAWSHTKSAALGDALSTAFMIMPEEAIKNYISDNQEVSALILPSEERGSTGKIRLFGMFE
jgi:thiamine biosynthesis lipoprotein